MAEQKEESLISKVCGGKSKEFANTPCQYYEADKKKGCQLLQEQKMDAFWQKCRKAWEIFYNIEKTLHEKFRGKYPAVDEDVFNYKDVISRINAHRLRIQNLAGWVGNVRTTIYREKRRALYKLGLVPEKNRCGTCKHLPKFKPYFCPKIQEIRRKTDKICDYDYEPNTYHFLPIREKEKYNTYEDWLLFPKSSEIPTPEKLLIEKEYRKQMEEFSMPVIKDLLKQRIKEQRPGSKKRERYKRQYEIFVVYIQLFKEEDLSEKDLVRKLVEGFHLDWKMVNRDLAEIKAFLKKKWSPCMNKRSL